jgi:hypothetical protein
MEAMRLMDHAPSGKGMRECVRKSGLEEETLSGGNDIEARAL